ncbi:carbohydrate-binding family 9-like protein [Flavihumibacter fluvii]|uniref:carbohydrate-binding family 9-like protein n=1 Tax=Flavihumibacter fluvii TaxID=2838157 RepID=UPI001BDE4AC2|nr:carbohydrate-binding family 9-like protein [Flavihumibacter fluvii]ULQ53274.1 carbohydrate-binding family 9-like protein [Flavihumibacter fluvii]
MKQAPDYIAHKIEGAIVIDGDTTKKVWQHAQWSKRFVDMVTGEPGMYNTQSAIVWNDTHVYFAFEAEEPFLEAKLTARDSIIFLENDLELLIDGQDCYYELEINAANTLYEVFFIWKDAYTKGSRFDIPEFDVHQPQAYTFGGDYDRTGASFWKGRHPRGIRWAFTNFDLPGLETAVQLQGSLNDHRDIDKGWTLEIAIPWTSLGLLANGRSIPPREGDIWNMFLGRFQKLMAGGQEVTPHPAMAMTSHGVYDTHLPDKWSKILFRTY